MADIKLYQGDCLAIMDSLPANSVDLIVTSPPYNKGYWSSNRNINNGFRTKARRIEYGVFKDRMLPAEYDSWQKEVIQECLRVLKPTGSLFYNHTDILKLHTTKHPVFVYDFPVKQVIIWNRKNTPKLDKSYFFPITEWVFWMKKTNEARVKFNRKNAKLNSNVWTMSPDTKNDFPAPFPIELPMNCIQACTEVGDIVFDPFMGSGTTGVACKKLNRNFIGIELDKNYFEIAKKRIENAGGLF